MPDLVGEAAAAALAGRLVIIPTDTVYGVGTCPDHPAWTRRIFEASATPAGYVYVPGGECILGSDDAYTDVKKIFAYGFAAHG